MLTTTTKKPCYITKYIDEEPRKLHKTWERRTIRQSRAVNVKSLERYTWMGSKNGTGFPNRIKDLYKGFQWSREDRDKCDKGLGQKEEIGKVLREKT